MVSLSYDSSLANPGLLLTWVGLSCFSNPLTVGVCLSSLQKVGAWLYSLPTVGAYLYSPLACPLSLLMVGVGLLSSETSFQMAAPGLGHLNVSLSSDSSLTL